MKVDEKTIIGVSIYLSKGVSIFLSAIGINFCD